MSPSSTPAPVFDPTRYPLTYAPSLGNRIIWISFGGLLAAGGAWGVWYSLIAGDQLGSKGSAVTIFLSLTLVLLGSYLIVSMLSSKVTLRADAIEVRNLVSRQTMLRQEVMARRIYFSTGTIELIPRDRNQKKLKIPYLMEPDRSFAAWFESIPDLDASESDRGEANSW